MSAAAFMTLGSNGRWDLVLRFRLDDLVALVIVGHAIGVSGVLFQTATENRILTPGVMGMDALFVMIALLRRSLFGVAGVHVTSVPLAFVIDVALMLGASALFCRWLLGNGQRGLHVLVLTGIVLGLLFRSVTAFVGRVGDPNALGGAGQGLAASDHDLLAVAIVVSVLAALVAWLAGGALDVLTLGRETAISLGIGHGQLVLTLLLVSSTLTAVATVLSGPTIFLGLVAANGAYLVTGSRRHMATVPAAALITIILLVGGRMVLQRLLGFSGGFGAVMDLVGGVAVIVMLLRHGTR